MNLIQIAGFLGADAEERMTATGKRVVMLRVATKTRQGGKDETLWWRVSIWGDRYDKMIPYLKKGTPLIVVGEMSKPEAYMDKNGQAQVSLNMTAEIIKFSPFGKPEKGDQAAPGSSAMSDPFGSSSMGEEMGGYSMGGNAGFGGGRQGGGHQQKAHSESEYEEVFAGDDLPF